ncbi:MAG: hypothetical protein HMLKMBBP_01443 [Planctomycetes bacterium]|nr:hypothetical protein [Planctomycetota bacterium]
MPARALRRGIGQPFHGRAAPAAAGVADLLDELLDTMNAPAAVESWPAPVRAAAFHFFLRLVQPWDADAAAPLAEAWALAADGFDGRAMLLPPAEPADPGTGKPDPDTFVRDRVHALVESLAATEELLRAECARTVLREDCAERASGLNARQRALVRWLSGPESRPLAFADYVRIHAGRRAPSLRSLQRDWKGLREGGWIEESDRGFELRSERAAWGPWAAPGGGALFTKG